MIYADINRKFTEIVNAYLTNGYTVNTSTMAGSQGEIAKIDLTDGKEIIRVKLEHFSEWGDGLILEGLQIVVGKSNEKVEPDVLTSRTIWDSNLEIISTERFCKPSFRARCDDFYSTESEAIAASDIAYSRYKARSEAKKQAERKENVTDKAFATGESICRRVFGVKRFDAGRMTVTKQGRCYTVTYGKRTYALH